MEINHIFGKLYAFKFKGAYLNEFYSAFEVWTDVELMKTFFELHEQDLNSGFYQNIISINEAVIYTQNEAYDFEELLEHYVNSDKLDSIFMDLDTKQYKHNIEVKKAYGIEYKSWLRLYALKVEDIYLITGSAIKLTKTMNEREHTNRELLKIEWCKDFLKSEGALGTAAIKELET